MAQKIRAYKLVTGEEIIGQNVALYKTNMIILERVRIVQMVQTGPQSVGVGMVPFSASNIDGRVEIYETAVVANIEPTKDIEDAYIGQTSGIQIANAPGGVLKR